MCHTCHNPSCVNPNHLYVGNRRTNLNDVIKDGSQRGEKNPQCKLSDVSCRNMRWLRSEGYSLRDLSILFDCSTSTVSQICNNSTRRSEGPAQVPRSKPKQKRLFGQAVKDRKVAIKWLMGEGFSADDVRIIFDLSRVMVLRYANDTK